MKIVVAKRTRGGAANRSTSNANVAIRLLTRAHSLAAVDLILVNRLDFNREECERLDEFAFDGDVKADHTRRDHRCHQ